MELAGVGWGSSRWVHGPAIRSDSLAAAIPTSRPHGPHTPHTLHTHPPLQVVVWHGAVLRGDLNAVRVGAFSSVGARSVLHAARSTPTGLPAATVVGRSVTIGDRCLLRSATVGDGAVLGEGCALLEGSVVGAGAVLQPGTVVPPGRLVPPAQVWGGKPARHVRDVSKDEVAANTAAADRAVALASSYAAEELPEGGFIYRDAERVRREAAKKAA